MTIPSDEYQQLINNVNSNMCRGCTKIALRDGKLVCYFSDNNIGLWNDLLNGWHCNYRENVINR